MTFGLKQLKKRSDQHQFGEVVPLQMAQSWPLGSQIVVKKKVLTKEVIWHFLFFKIPNEDASITTVIFEMCYF